MPVIINCNYTTRYQLLLFNILIYLAPYLFIYFINVNLHNFLRQVLYEPKGSSVVCPYENVYPP